MRPLPSSQRCTSPQVSAAASERLSPGVGQDGDQGQVVAGALGGLRGGFYPTTAATPGLDGAGLVLGLRKSRPHPFKAARTPWSRHGDSSLAHSWALVMALVASRIVAMLAPSLARAAR